ncbi:hypothetical protein LZC95_47980 [Pendulispora brunnea]|uniref:Uncharacterized protein n=1 Tax=Pendulispora brunnea TaxID=2905690 RepID=A0ABZ2K649_9BACT
MTLLNRRLVGILGAGTLALALVRCGGGSDGPGNPGTPPRDGGPDGDSLGPAAGFEVFDLNVRKARSVHATARDIPSATAFRGKIYFSGSDHDHGAELWVSDGTAEGTKLAIETAPGTADAWPSAPLAAFDSIFFSASDGTTWNLYRSDGTQGGTRIVGALPTGIPGVTSYADIEQTFVAGERVCVLLGAASPVWCTDSARSSLSHLTAIPNAPVDEVVVSTASYALLRVNGNIVRTDGTDAGTTTLPGPTGSLLRSLVMNDRVILSGYASGVGYSVWVTDGTAAGTRKVDGIPAGSRELEYAVRVGNSAVLSIDGKLYVLDPATLTVSSVSGAPTPDWTTKLLSVTDSRALLLQGKDVWAIEGEPAAAKKIATIPTDPYAVLQPWTQAPGAAFFWDDDINEGKVWRSDGTAEGTVALGTMASLGPARYPTDTALTRAPAVMGPDWIFFVCENETSWPTPCAMKFADGKLTVIPVEDRTAPSDPTGFFPLEGGSGAVFAANASFSLQYRQSWFTDGTRAGTRSIGPVHMGPPAKLGDRYFIVRASGNGWGKCELASWRGQATDIATVHPLELDFLCDPTGGRFDLPMMALGQRVFFADANEEVHSSDGTPSGQRKEVAIGRVTEGARWIVRGDALYLPTPNGLARIDANGQVVAKLGSGRVTAVDEASGYLVFGGERLFVSDGTPGGTVQVSPASNVTRVHATGPHRAFALGNKIVYRLDGTTAFQIVSDVEAIVPFRDGLAIDTFNHGLQVVLGNANVPIEIAPRSNDLFVHGDRLHFVRGDGLAWSGAPGEGEPWVSDGTPAGTRALGEIVPGPASPRIRWLGNLNDAAFLAADTERHGRELVRFASP